MQVSVLQTLPQEESRSKRKRKETGTPERKTEAYHVSGCEREQIIGKLLD